MNKLKLSLVLLVVVLLTVISTAFASGSPYIQINNSTIVTNQGQKPQIVAQFGNRSQHTLENISVTCPYSQDLGTPGETYPRALKTSSTLNNILNLDYVFFGSAAANIDLLPGQNYDVAFSINITAARGAFGGVQCQLYSNNNLIAFSDIPTIKVQ